MPEPHTSSGFRVFAMTVQHVSLSNKPSAASPAPRSLDTDIAVLGAGADAALTALVLARGGRRVAVIATPRGAGAGYRTFTPAQAARLRTLGVGSRLPFGPDLSAGGISESGLRIALTAAWPETVARLDGAVTRILPHRLTPVIDLADGRTLTARLIVIVSDPGPALMAALGLRRYLMSEAHLVCVSLRLSGPAPDAFVMPGARARDGVGHAHVFPLLDQAGAGVNLYLYNRPGGARLDAFRADPQAALCAALPRLKARLGGGRIDGPARIDVRDLYDVARPSRAGVALIGAARRGDCPATGEMRLLDDLEALAAAAPDWLEQGADLHRLAAFYNDEARRRREAQAHRRALIARALAVDTRPHWRLRRWLRAGAWSPPSPRPAAHPAPAFAPGQSVRVRSAVEILATLDGEGRLGGLPFMPEMAAHIGAVMRVRRRAGRACVEGEGLRGMDDAVFLDAARCDGSSHDGCQRGCDTFWKSAWLSDDLNAPPPPDAAERKARLRLLHLATRRGEKYLCQSTALKTATQPLPPAHLRVLLREVRQGDMPGRELVRLLGRGALNKARRLFGLPELDRIVGAPGLKSRGALDLRPGDWVRVRDAEAIRATLDPASCNLGLSFEPEMALAIGQVRQVDRVVTRIVHEVTGEMVTLARTVTLKGLVCGGACAKGCPRANPLFWREAWLERVPAPDQVSDRSPSQS